jgi:hypothetical protein
MTERLMTAVEIATEPVVSHVSASANPPGVLAPPAGATPSRSATSGRRIRTRTAGSYALGSWHDGTS